ncbi:hypothetical protein DAMA08_013050 [Martiniozyma asiatica (nom. inval.)]|nr:hypothetical protein DAMA08_013050 [Martiniozyma asiatica]
MSKGLVEYSDPLINLLHSPNLNKEKDLSNELLTYIEDIEDKKIKQWCIDALTVLRDLEKIEFKLHGWETQTLDFKLSMNENSSDLSISKSKSTKDIKLQLAKRVLDLSLSLHEQLNDLSDELLLSVDRARSLSPIQIISDPGTILTELVLRLTKLKEGVFKEVSVVYSRAKLTIIGCQLEDMLKTPNANIGGNASIDSVVVKNYKQFVNNLLMQIDDAVSDGDTVGLMECIALVGDIERMFESMKGPETQRQSPPISTETTNDDEKHKRSSVHTQENTKDEEDVEIIGEEEVRQAKLAESKNTPVLSTAKQAQMPEENDGYESDITLVSPMTNSTASLSTSHRRTTSNLRSDDDLTRTTISEQLPGLLSAFKSSPLQKSTDSKLKSQSNSHSHSQSNLHSQSQSQSQSKLSADVPQSSLSSIEETSQDLEEEDDEDVKSIPLEDKKLSPIPPISSMFGSSILHAFYQPQVLKPIYVPTSSVTGVADNSTGKLLEGNGERKSITQHSHSDMDDIDVDDDDVDSGKEVNFNPTEVAHQNAVLDIMYKASQSKQEALEEERQLDLAGSKGMLGMMSSSLWGRK